MNLTKKCPDIHDNCKYSIADVCRLLGDGKPISRHTVYKYINLGQQRGGIAAKRALSGRFSITGREVKRLWAIM